MIIVLNISPVGTDEDIELVRILLAEYLAWLEDEKWISLQESQAFEEQLANLPGGFAPPDGCILLAVQRGQAAGCVALRKLNDSACEMKRVYVTPEFRGLKIGRKLAEAIIERACEIGYTHMCIHTLAAMQAANTLCRSLGSEEIAPHEENIVTGSVFMELKLV
ncbi:MAG: GNAT family N-acetyltransferase [Planctomycetota bacterium]